MSNKYMPHTAKQLPRSDTALPMDRAQSIKFKLMPDGHIRGFRTNRKDLPGVSELQIYHIQSISPTLTAAHEPKLLIIDERVNAAIQEAAKGL
jgi:hypothetical protein